MAESDIATNVGLIVMGPCACGKSEIGLKLAEHYNCSFMDGDDFHSEENVKKMRDGIPLTDQDRTPWLQRLRQEMITAQQKPCLVNSDLEVNYSLKNPKKYNIRIVASCSALKKSYRNILRGKTPQGDSDNQIHTDIKDDKQNPLKVIFVFLNCSREVLQQRLNARKGHFMKAGMLESQLNTLELPDEEEKLDFVTVNGDLEMKLLISDIVFQLDKFDS